MEDKNNIIGRNIAFIHVPRTAGTYFASYLTNILKKKGYKIINSWENLKRDWNKKELLSFLEIKDSQPIFVHNHKENWDKETIEKYKEEGWFLISFVRHPGDRLCSAYFMWCIKHHPEISLNDYILQLIKGIKKEKGKTIPSYWKDLDFIAEFNEKKFTFFLKKYFNHNYKLRKPINTSSNKGYKYYCKTNQISKTTQKLLKNSKDYEIYLKIFKKNKLEYYIIILKKLIQKIFDTLFPKKPL